MTQSEALVAPLRVLAVLFSVGVGGYLVWAAQEHQGPAPEDPGPTEERTPELGAEPAQVAPNVATDASQEPAADTAKTKVDPVMLYSSKSAPIDPMELFPPLEGQPSAESSDAAADDLDPVLLFSSKSAPIDPEALEAALKEAGVEVEPQPRFLPSSKVIITPEVMPKPEDRVFLSSSKSAPLHLIEPQSNQSQPSETHPNEPAESEAASVEPAEEATKKPTEPTEPTEQSGGSRP